jgi:hypothetical protein
MAGEFPKESVGAFWAKVDVKGASECWPWTGAKTQKGYGNVRLLNVYWKSHRLAWTLVNFAIPDGFMVCHVCDNPSCCNPGHLVLGSARANFTDMVQKNRGEFRKNKAIGGRNTNSKLSDALVIELRSSYAAGEANQYQLAEKYGVTQPCIGAIVRRETWRHI